MQRLLLLVGLSLLSAVRAQESPENLLLSATSKMLLGKWYINRWIGTIPIPKEKKQEPLPPFSFVINYNGKLEFRMHIRKPSGCQLLKLPFIKVSYDDGFLTWWKHMIYIWMILPRGYGIAYFEDKINNQDMKMMMLFGRTLDDHPDALNVFERTVKWKGLNVTDIINPPHVESCKLASDPS